MLLCVLAPGVALAAAPRETEDFDMAFVEQLTALPTEELIERGRELGYEQHQPRQALVCFTIAAERYNPSMSKEEKALCVEALNLEYEALSNSLFDYSRAYDCLQKATQISREAGVSNPHLLFNYATYYQQAYNSTGERRYLDKAYEAYVKAYEQSMRQGDVERLNQIMPNMIALGYPLGHTDQVREMVQRYAAVENSDTTFRTYNLLMSSALGALAKGDAKTGESEFDRQLSSLPDTRKTARQRAMTMLQLGRIYSSSGRVAQALAMTDSVIAIAAEYSLDPIRVDALREREMALRRAGNTQMAAEARMRFLEAKDSLLSERVSNNVRSVEVMSELSAAGVELRQMREERARALWLAAVIGTVLLLGCVFLVVIVRQNRRLRESNRLMFQKNRVLLSTDQPLMPLAKPGKEQSDDKDSDADGEEDEPDAEALQQRELLWARIRSYIFSAPEVFDPDFNLAQLASVMNTNTRYVSEAINRNYGAGLPALLGEARIKEACRRMQDIDNYGNLTLDNIAQGVGIRSRTTFLTLFKRVVGMKPSDFMREARENRESALLLALTGAASSVALF